MDFTVPHLSRRRRQNLTPMIDVVFLLLVFFMLASRFGTDQALTFSRAGESDTYNGPPRLVDISPDNVLLNGVLVSLEDLLNFLPDLMESPEDIVVLRGSDDATVNDVVKIVDLLREAGLTRIVLVE